jgi:hypothetical protein
VAKKRRRQNEERLAVTVRHIACADSDVRVARAIDILLRSASVDTAQPEESDSQKEKHPRHAPARDGPTGDGDQGSSCVPD